MPIGVSMDASAASAVPGYAMIYGNSGDNTVRCRLPNGTIVQLSASVINYVKVAHTAVAGTGGGTPTAATWSTRPINTIINDPSSIIISLSGNQLTMPAGTYEFLFAAAHYNATSTAGVTRVRLRNTSNTTTLGVNHGNAIVNVASSALAYTLVGSGRFTLSGVSVLELQYYTTAAIASIGLGVGGPAAASEDEIHASLELWRIA